MSDLSHMYWIGGSPCAGKSSIAHLIAARQGWQSYPCDDMFEEHSKRARHASEPVFSRLISLSWNELWMSPVEQQVANEVAMYREEFPMILDDLCRLAHTPILAEGAALLPECVASVPGSKARSVWIVPTPDFQRHHYAQRSWAWDIAIQCDDPPQAFANWMERDIRFARIVAEQAQDLGLPLIVVDGTRSIADIAEQVSAYFTGVVDGTVNLTHP